MKYSSPLILLFLSTFLGCGSGGRDPNRQAIQDPTATSDYFDRGIDRLRRSGEFNPKEARAQAAMHLNRWAVSQKPLANWAPEPLLESLPNSLRNIPPLENLERKKFDLHDMRFLQQAMWMRGVSQWASSPQSPLEQESWLEALGEQQTPEHAARLATVWRLFNWTIRNIQLQELPNYPRSKLGPSLPGGQKSGGSPMEQAVVGPGYTQYPWETLLYGQGDAWQRAEVFMQLARQLEIDVVMLAFDDASARPRPRPWLPAAWLDGRLYLFDCALGVPIPQEGDRGVATLEEVRENPQLLKQLSLTDLPYPVTEPDWSQLTVLISASPVALSMRMQQAENRLDSSQRMILAVRPSMLARALKEHPAIDRVELWKTPLETWVFRTEIARRIKEDPAQYISWAMRDWTFDNNGPMPRARNYYLLGELEKTDRKEGAKAKYLRARVTDSILKQVPESEELQQELGIVRTIENDEQWQSRLKYQVLQLQTIKYSCNYWLGLAHLESNRLAAAEEWLKGRTLEMEDSPWRSGARYNLALTYQRMGKTEEARRLLLLDDSPQKHGNLLLARRWNKR